MGSPVPFGGTSFALRQVPMRGSQARVGQPRPATGKAATALRRVEKAQRDLRGIERNLVALEEALGPEGALAAFEQAQASVDGAWGTYVEAAGEIEQ